MKAIIRTSSSLVRKDRMGSTLRVLLNLVTGWQCPGFCAGDDEKSQTDCETICGLGRMERAPQLEG